MIKNKFSPLFAVRDREIIDRISSFILKQRYIYNDDDVLVEGAWV